MRKKVPSHIIETRYQELACAVLKQAVKDYRRGDLEVDVFLDIENPDFRFWCEMAGVEPDYLLKLIKTSGLN